MLFKTYFSDHRNGAAMDRSFLTFCLFVLGVCVAFAGILYWVGSLDYDHHYELEGTYEELPPNEGAYRYYSSMPPEKQRIIDGAIDGRFYTFPNASKIPPELIRRGDTYYLFEYRTSFDWTDPDMAKGVAVFLAGVLLVLEALRREQLGNRRLLPEHPFGD